MKEKRRYRLGRRAEQQAETRRRIVESAVELHSTLGPAATTLSAIAKRAGVQRHTLYAHFPDEITLFTACSAHWQAQHPFPDEALWAEIGDPRGRLRRALEEIYGWYEANEEALTLFARDGYLFPPWRAAGEERLRRIASGLARGLPRRRAVRAAVGHALDFSTWRSLARGQGLGKHAATDLMVRLVFTAGAGDDTAP